MTSPSPVDVPHPLGSPHPALVVRTVAVPVTRVGHLLALLPEPEDAGDIVSWVRKGEGLVGWGRVATFRAIGADRFGLLGMSFGGPYALACAARHPLRVTAAVTGDPAVFVSVSAAHQGPEGGGPVAAIVDLG